MGPLTDQFSKREFARWCYRLLLKREPESEAVLDIAFESIVELKRYFYTSWEFKRTNLWSPHELPGNRPETIDFIKMDIEGSEVAALRGMRKLLHCYDYPPIFTVMNAYALCLQEETQLSLLRFAKELGYDIFEIHDRHLTAYGREKDPEEYGAYICFALKDYPQYYNHPEIKALLTEIAPQKGKNPFLNRALAWWAERPEEL